MPGGAAGIAAGWVVGFGCRNSACAARIFPAIRSAAGRPDLPNVTTNGSRAISKFPRRPRGATSPATRTLNTPGAVSLGFVIWIPEICSMAYVKMPLVLPLVRFITRSWPSNESSSAPVQSQSEFGGVAGRLATVVPFSARDDDVVCSRWQERYTAHSIGRWARGMFVPGSRPHVCRACDTPQSGTVLIPCGECARKSP